MRANSIFRLNQNFGPQIASVGSGKNSQEQNAYSSRNDEKSDQKGMPKWQA